MERLEKIQEQALSMHQECNLYSLSEIKRKTKSLEHKYKYLHTEVPHLFEKICNKQYKSEEFTYMLQCLTRVHTQNTTLHDESVKVGSMLVDKYIKPVIGEK